MRYHELTEDDTQTPYYEWDDVDIRSTATQQEASTFVRGYCHAFAIALSRLTGSPIVKIHNPSGSITHYMVKHGEYYWDILGARSEETIEDTYGWHDASIDTVSEQEVFNDTSGMEYIDEDVISQATDFARKRIMTMM